MQNFKHFRYLFFFILIIFCLFLESCSRYSKTLAPVVYGEPKKLENTQEQYEKDGYIKIFSGDTLESISKKYNVSVPDLIKINKLESPFIIQPGEYLKLPYNSFYVVKRGDTLTSISKCLNINMKSIIRTNKLTDPFKLLPGQVLYIKENYKKRDCLNIKETKIITNENNEENNKNIVKSLFSWPTDGKIVSTFGPKDGGKINDGINILAAEGNPVRAARSGTIVYAGNEIPAYGTLIIIRHTDGWTTAYAHLSKVLVNKGDIINKKNVIATVGNTGTVITPQLHFEIRYKSKPVNPLKYLSKR